MTGDVEPTQTDAPPRALRSWIDAHQDALVIAMGPSHRPVAVPDSIQLGELRSVTLRRALDLVVPEDRVALIDAWSRALTEPIVRFTFRTSIDQSTPVAATIFDVRAEHGVHMIALDPPDTDALLDALHSQTDRVLIATVKRDPISVFLEVDDATSALLGWEPHELLGRRTLDLLHPDDLERAIEGWMTMRKGADTGRTQVRYRHRSGHYVWLEVDSESHLDDPEEPHVISELIDISREMAELEAMRDREQALAKLASALPFGVCQLRATGSVAYANEPMIDLLGSFEHLDDLLARFRPVDAARLESLIERARSGARPGIEITVERNDSLLRCELTCRPLPNESDEEDIILCASDVTERTQLRDELEHRATHDALSGCLNRSALVTALERMLLTRGTVTVAYIDLDGFKAINDQHGHAAGDEVLRVTAQRLRRVTRAEDLIGRVGGDEFVVVSTPPHPFEWADASDDDLAARLTDALAHAVQFHAHAVPTHASVGIARSMPEETDAEAVLRRADLAMYGVKEHNRETRRTARPGLD